MGELTVDPVGRLAGVLKDQDRSLQGGKPGGPNQAGGHGEVAHHQRSLRQPWPQANATERLHRRTRQESNEPLPLPTGAAEPAMDATRAARGELSQEQRRTIGEAHAPARTGRDRPALLQHPSAAPAASHQEQGIDRGIKPGLPEGSSALLISPRKPAPLTAELGGSQQDPALLPATPSQLLKQGITALHPGAWSKSGNSSATLQRGGAVLTGCLGSGREGGDGR